MKKVYNVTIFKEWSMFISLNALSIHATCAAIWDDTLNITVNNKCSKWVRAEVTYFSRHGSYELISRQAEQT